MLTPCLYHPHMQCNLGKCLTIYYNDSSIATANLVHTLNHKNWFCQWVLQSTSVPYSCLAFNSIVRWQLPPTCCLTPQSSHEIVPQSTLFLCLHRNSGRHYQFTYSTDPTTPLAASHTNPTITTAYEFSLHCNNFVHWTKCIEQNAPLQYHDIYIDDFIMIAQKPVHLQACNKLFHALDHASMTLPIHHDKP
jgi:hypothetical protein